MTDRALQTPTRRRAVAVVATAAAVLLAAAALAPLPASAQESLLLVGNSFTSGLRPRLRKLARSAGYELSVRASARRGAALADHATSRSTLRRLRGGGWTHVVLQEQSDGFPAENYPDARSLDGEIASVGASTLFLMTWRDRDDDLESWNELLGEPGGDVGYVPIAFELGAGIAPAGWVFREILIEEGDADLWSRDGHHAGERGRYVVAMTLFAALYRESPVGLWAPASLAAEQVLHDQLLVDAVVLGQALQWNLGAIGPSPIDGSGEPSPMAGAAE